MRPYDKTAYVNDRERSVRIVSSCGPNRSALKPRGSNPVAQIDYASLKGDSGTGRRR